MHLLVGSKGDTDYEEIVSGTHKTVVLDNLVEEGSDKLLRAGNGYGRGEFVADDSANVVHLAEYTTEGIQEVTTKKFGWR